MNKTFLRWAGYIAAVFGCVLITALGLRFLVALELPQRLERFGVRVPGAVAQAAQPAAPAPQVAGEPLGKRDYMAAQLAIQQRIERYLPEVARVIQTKDYMRYSDTADKLRAFAAEVDAVQAADDAGVERGLALVARMFLHGAADQFDYAADGGPEQALTYAGRLIGNARQVMGALTEVPVQ